MFFTLVCFLACLFIIVHLVPKIPSGLERTILILLSFLGAFVNGLILMSYLV